MQGDGGNGEPGQRHDGERGVARGQQRRRRTPRGPAGRAGHHASGGDGVEERAGAERGQQGADHAEAQAEALVQLGADVGQGAEHGHALDEHADQHGARPAILQHAVGGGRGLAPARAAGGATPS